MFDYFLLSTCLIDIMSDLRLACLILVHSFSFRLLFPQFFDVMKSINLFVHILRVRFDFLVYVCVFAFLVRMIFSNALKCRCLFWTDYEVWSATLDILCFFFVLLPTLYGHNHGKSKMCMCESNDRKWEMEKGISTENETNLWNGMNFVNNIISLFFSSSSSLRWGFTDICFSFILFLSHLSHSVSLIEHIRRDS